MQMMKQSNKYHVVRCLNHPFIGRNKLKVFFHFSLALWHIQPSDLMYSLLHLVKGVDMGVAQGVSPLLCMLPVLNYNEFLIQNLQCSKVLNYISKMNLFMLNIDHMHVNLIIYSMRLYPHTCHCCCQFATVSTRIKSTCRDMNQAVHHSEPCILVTRLAHTAQKN